MIKDSFECSGTVMASPELVKILDRYGLFVSDKLGRPFYKIFLAGLTKEHLMRDMCERSSPLLSQPSENALFSLLNFLGFWRDNPAPNLSFCMHADDYRRIQERAQMFGRCKPSDQGAARQNLLLRRKTFTRVEEESSTQNVPLDMNELNAMILRYAESFRYKKGKTSVSNKPAENRAHVSWEERHAWRQRLADPYNAFHEKHAAFTLRLLDMIESMENERANNSHKEMR